MFIRIRAAPTALWLRFAKWRRVSVRPLPKHISDHLARDIGMSTTDLDRHRFVWPSDGPDRPLL